MASIDPQALFKTLGIKVRKVEENYIVDEPGYGPQRMVIATRQCPSCKSRTVMTRAEPGCTGENPEHSHPYQWHVGKVQPQGRPLCEECVIVKGEQTFPTAEYLVERGILPVPDEEEDDA